MNNLVEIGGITKVYDAASPQKALSGVSLRIPTGEVTAIMGPSGSGKSTLLNLLAGLDRATSGTIVVDGTEITRLSEAVLARYRRQKIGLIFQFFNLLNNLTVLDNVLIPAQLAGTSRRVAEARAAELLERLSIADQARKYPARLSGGQRQRVAIARALINRPALLLADEPTGALDTRSGDQVLDLFRDLNRTGQTIVLVTHDPRLAERCAQRTITLVDGLVIRDTATLEAVG
ncbi:MAG TPA: ABC transporter ATP-binding protein [Chloroflexota bacterium]|nr:ABC transporter ATP-binding protein [Chloroflexota bacterium]